MVDILNRAEYIADTKVGNSALRFQHFMKGELMMKSEAKDDSGHHVLPLKIYLGVAGALLLMTIITVAAAQFNFGAWNLVIAMAIAAMKALLVVLFFMHLKYDSGIYGIAMGGAILFLSIFIVFTMFDTLHRGDTDPMLAQSINPHARIYDASGRPLGKQARQAVAKASTISDFELKHGIGPIKEEVKLGTLDLTLANKGKEIFDMKCATCHKLDERYTGPALRDVTKRRSGAFIMNQILNPDENVKRHPEGKKLLAEYLTFMTFQNVTQADARALLEYLRASGENKEPK